jgi:histidinol phosphatase-like PHP family hydrolase
MPVTNAALADLLYGAAEDHSDQKARALQRAGRYALTWKEEAAEILEQGRSLTELPAVGPWVARRIEELVEEPPDVEPHEFRSGFITLAEARRVLEEHPDWKQELRGDLQMHSTYSDGTVPVAGMAAAAVELGYEYIAITDHSKGLRIAGGIDETVLARQREEIDEVNTWLGEAEGDLRVLRSTELNFGTDGSGDMEPSALAQLDIVVGSFHSKLRRKEDQTDRCLGAVANPDVQVIGHPMGRMFGRRAGVQADWGRVFEEGARRGKAFEINAQPDRQDLSVDMLRLAHEAGALFSIGTDAHSVAELYTVDLSLAAAILAGIGKDRILNFRPLEELLAWVAESRGGVRR